MVLISMMSVIEAKSDNEKKNFHSKVEQYLARAEEIKKIVKSSEQGICGVESVLITLMLSSFQILISE